VRQEDVDTDYLFGSFLAAIRTVPEQIGWRFYTSKIKSQKAVIRFSGFTRLSLSISADSAVRLNGGRTPDRDGLVNAQRSPILLSQLIWL